MKRLKIALVANNIHFRGGMERYCAELANAFCAEHEVHLFASEIDNVALDKLTIHRVKTVKRPVLTLFVQFYLRSSRLVCSRDFDIVHSIGGITAHQNVLTAQYCQYAWGEVLRKEAGRIEGVSPYHQFMWRMAGYFEKKAVLSSETLAISANSRRTKSDVQRHYGCAADKIEVIYNGVDPARFSPANRRYRSDIRRHYGISEDQILVVFAGEYRRKGLATAIRALGHLKNPAIRLLAVGRGDHAHYMGLANRVGVGAQVILDKPSPTIEQVYGAADMFVFPTFYEPFGMVVTEAMVSGLPVITTERAGAAEFIADGKSGFLVGEPADATSFAEKIQALADDLSLRQSMGEEARSSAASYSWATVAQKTLSLYGRICEPGRSVSA